MPENGFELRNVAWTQAFPFLRLFRTFRLSIGFTRLILALLAVAGVYIGGRILDGVWKSAGAGVLVVPERHMTEVDAYAKSTAEEFARGREAASSQREEKIVSAAIALENAKDRGEARKKLAEGKESELLATTKHEKDVATARDFIAEQLNATRVAIDGTADLTNETKEQRVHAAEEVADYLRCVLDRVADKTAYSGDSRAALAALVQSAGGESSETQRSAQETTIKALAAAAALEAVDRSEPQGPFIALLQYESRCFAGAIRGACTFHWGFAGGPSDSEPSLLGSIGSAFSGVSWMATQRPCFFVFYGLLHFAIFALFGGALCRHAAVQIAREESIGMGAALRFARDKYAGLVFAPLFPLGVFIAIAIVVWVGGLIGAIPFIGEILTGILYGLALVGGFAMAMVLIATVLGLHLMWPTIAVESSDSLDAVTHAVTYVSQRTWHFAFYTVVTLLYGAVCFVMVRVIAMLTLKLAHLFTNAGMSFFGAWSGGGTETITKFNAMWHMPHWGELSLLPTTSGAPFWGTFHTAPLGSGEWLAMFFLQCWVFLVVGLVGAFVVSFFFCGSTHMFFLLRRDVDAVEYDEIFIEETADDFLPATETSAAAADGAHPADESKPPSDAG